LLPVGTSGDNRGVGGQNARVPTHVGLLRGINLAGRNRMAMANLRSVVESLGHSDVATYIQSGNVVFTAADPAAGSDTLAAELEKAIAVELGVAPRVTVRSSAELAEVEAANPFADEPNPKLVHAFFLLDEPGPDVAAFVTEAQAKAAAAGSRDEARIVGRTLYLHTPDGFGRSELAAQLSKGGRNPVAGTARNWATVRKLLEMCGAS
jgi:uncharacterized protein (DUF1697 family)